MQTGKHLAGVALFLFIFGATVITTNLLRAPAGAVPPVEVDAEPLTIAETARQPVNYSVRMVSLDFIRGKSYTTLLLKREPGLPAPEKLLVRTRFFSPSGAHETWSTLGEIQRPFSHGERVEITAKADCDWCEGSKAPKAGYFAQVYVSTDYADARVEVEPAARDTTNRIPVLVQSERNTNPFSAR